MTDATLAYRRIEPIIRGNAAQMSLAPAKTAAIPGPIKLILVK